MNTTLKTQRNAHSSFTSTAIGMNPGRVRTRRRVPGITVAIIGPDGAGKSTLIESIHSSGLLPTTVVYMGGNAATANHALPTTRWLVRHGQIDTWAPDTVASMLNKSRSPVALGWRGLREAVKFANELLDFAYRYGIASVARRRGDVVLFDRYIYDPMIDALVDGASSFGWFRARLFRGIFPRPDVVIILNAPGDLLFARKGEHSPERLDRMLRACRWLVKDFRRVTYLDATRPIGEVLHEAIATIQDNLAEQRG